MKKNIPTDKDNLRNKKKITSDMQMIPDLWQKAKN